MKTRSILSHKAISTAFAIVTGSAEIFAQAKSVRVPPPAEGSFFDSYGLYVGIVAIGGLIAAAVMMRKKAASALKAAASIVPGGGFRMTYREKPQGQGTRPRKAPVQTQAVMPVKVEAKTGFAALPVSSFVRLQRANAFLQLPESRDAALLDAVEQVNEESEEDVQGRTQALKLLASFKTSNSISAIAQMALYDLSSKLRSDAVQVLAVMDHESVFETIVTCCADPTREVRASAARGLFKLNFDRAQAWTRVIETEDAARMRHVARSAVEGDLVERSFDRLIHPDRKVAYEAYAVTALLVRAGEAEPVFKALAEHRDENVKLALLHVLQTIRDDNTFEGLSSLLNSSELTPDIAAKVNEVRSYLQLTHA